MISITNFSDISERHLLRFGARYVDFWKNQHGEIFDGLYSTIPLKNIVSFASAKVINKNRANKIYQLIDLANIEPGTGYPLNLEENIVSEIGSDKIYLGDADIVFSKLNSHIGYVFLTSEITNNGHDLIGSTEFFPLVVDADRIYPKLLKYYLLHQSFRNKAVFLRSGKSQSHPRIQKDDFFNLRIPLFDKASQTRLLKKIEKIEAGINSSRDKIESLQSIIDQVFTKYSLKSKSESNYRTRTLIPSLTNVAKNKALRIGAEYNDFWLFHNGRLFAGTDETIKILPLKEIMKLVPKNTLKKGQLEEPRILIDFAQVESLNGKVNDFDNIVIELGSDRIEFGHCDFLTNKLRPYLGYTILNSPGLNLIGTTEFIPFQIRDEKKVMTEYIRYLLLSTEYLGKSKFLMSGKEHPRITSIDILNIKVPLPGPEVQQKIVEEISKREAKAQKAREEIKKLRASIDETILKELEKL